jgi:hypothetical protein
MGRNVSLAQDIQMDALLAAEKKAEALFDAIEAVGLEEKSR